jgi:Fe-S-cluster containining protein
VPGAEGLSAADADLLRVFDEALARSARALGPALDFGRGCPACCIGPFPINALDAWRLRRGLQALDPARAGDVRARARAAVAVLRPHFPGDADRGVFAADDAAEEAFCERFATLACPALDPGSGRCDLYAHRPLACRSYGLPVRIGITDLPPCRLCVEADPGTLERCRAEPDPQHGERALLERLESATGAAGETLIAFALAGTP